MWDQIRVDHGKEFYLSLFIQEMIEGYRNRRERQPYMQTQSTKVQYELNLHNTNKLSSDELYLSHTQLYRV